MDNPRQDSPSTYFVQNRSNQDEMTRLQVQGQMVTAGMGGVLPEQPDPTIFQKVLDVGCGTGDWLIEAAKTYPGISLLIGADISMKMLAYAQSQAEQQQVNNRVEFVTMDVLRKLEFPDEFFDLVNQRFGMSYLRTWDWSKVLQEYQRVCKPGGVIRVTECKLAIDSNCPSLARVFEFILAAFYQAGHFFTPTRDGVITQLARLMKLYGVQNVQAQSYTLEYHAGTPEAQSFYEDMKHLFRTIPPFLKKWGHMPDDYETLCQQALTELQRPDFAGTWELLTAWGTNSNHATAYDVVQVP